MVIGKNSKTVFLRFLKKVTHFPSYLNSYLTSLESLCFSQKNIYDCIYSISLYLMKYQSNHLNDTSQSEIQRCA